MHKFYKRTFLLLILLLLIVIPAAGNMAQTWPTVEFAQMSPNMITITTAPAEPTFSWVSSMETIPEYRLVVQRVENKAIVLDTIIDATVNCPEGGIIDISPNIDECEVPSSDYTLPGWGLVNDDYFWWVGVFRPDKGNIWEWSPKATFAVNVPAPVLPGTITVYPMERPWVQFDNDPNTFWVQVWIGPHPDGNYNQWYERDGDGRAFTCPGATCLIAAIAWDRASKDATSSPYDLTVWMRAWGPGGFSSGGVSGWSQLSMVNSNPATTFNLPLDPAPTPTSLAFDVNTANFTWQSGSPASWHNLMAYDSATGTGVGGNSWHLGKDIGCPGFILLASDYSCSVNIPSWTADHLTGTAPSYDLYVRSWGPGGMSDWVKAPMSISN